MFYVSPEGDRYYLGKAFKYKLTHYSFTSATHPKFMELGFTQVLVEPRPDDRFYIVAGPGNDGTYSKNPRALEDCKKRFCGEQVSYAQDALKSSDYLYARAAEQTTKRSGEEVVAVPAAVVTQRDAIRATCKANCALIEATSSVEELEQLIKAPRMVVEDDSLPTDQWEMVVNPEPHIEPLPTIDMSEYLTAELI